MSTYPYNAMQQLSAAELKQQRRRELLARDPAAQNPDGAYQTGAAAMSEAAPAREAPAELWVRPTGHGGYYQTTLAPLEGSGVVRYVRADLYEALQARMAVVRSWNEAPCLEPLETDYP